MAAIEIATPHSLRGSTLLFSPTDVLNAIGELQAAGAQLLGADCFKLHEGGAIQPIGEVDVSGPEFDGDAFDAVRQFVTAGPNTADTAYELVWN